MGYSHKKTTRPIGRNGASGFLANYSIGRSKTDIGLGFPIHSLWPYRLKRELVGPSVIGLARFVSDRH